MNYLNTLIGVVLVTIVYPAQAFEWVTHGAITSHAWSRMITLDENKTLLSRLGIQDGVDAFGTNTYYDFGTTSVRLRTVLPFEKEKMGSTISPLEIQGWLARGAIREDDDPDKKDDSPKDDDPDGDMHRV